jgi:GTPase
VSEHSQGYRCGTVAILGRPNAGKSTLLNALLGEKIAITSARAQTTRGRMLGVLTRADAQLLFYDTPGVHRGQAKFNLAMTDAALEAAREADVRLVLLDAAARWDEPEERLAALPAPTLLVRTKCDLHKPSPVPGVERFADVLAISAQDGAGLPALLERVVRELPESPALYPEDTLTDKPLRFLVAEQIREVAFELLRDEVPYSLAVEVEGWEETDTDLRLRANLLMERESQKGIVVGVGGRMLGAIGTESRLRLGERLGKTVHLNLWVKTDPNWSKKPARIRALGYL